MPGGDLSFEKKFSQLAYAQIAEKVPSLVSHYKGFQLIDKNDEETEAVGVAAFLVNDLFMYVPVFFLEGDIKGTDLLYVYQRDMFVPTTDNWVVSLKKYGLNTLGKSVTLSGPDQMGYTEPGGVTLDSMNFENIRKMASEIGSDPNTIIPADALEKMAACRNVVLYPSLAGGVKGLGKKATEALVRTMAHNVDFTNAMLKIYDVDNMKKLAAEAVESISESLEPTVHDKVVVVESSDDDAAEDLDDKQKKLLLRNGAYVVDHRANPSKVYRDRVNTDTVQNPQSSGLYGIMKSDGKTKEMVVVRAARANCPVRNSDRRSRQDSVRSLLLIDPENASTANLVKASDVYGAIDDKFNGADMEQLDKLEVVSRMALETAVQKVKDYYEKPYDKRPKNAPPRLYALLNGKDDAVIIRLNDHACCPENEEDPNVRVSIETPSWSSVPYLEDNNFVVRIAKNKKLETVGDVMMIPEGTKMIPVQMTPPFELGRPETITGLAHKAEKEGSLARLRVKYDGTSAVITTRSGSTPQLTKVAALKTLVFHHGIGGQEAQAMLKEAAQARSGYAKEYLVQYSGHYKEADISTGYSAYGEPTFGSESSSDKRPGNASYKEDTSVLYDVKTKRDRSGYGTSEGLLGEDAVDQAVAASQAGIKEVFDTTVLKQLLDVADLSELRSDYVNHLMKATDSIGRLLFLFYWHRDNFEDRYGRQEISKLESTFRNVFQSVGDLTLFLREKTTEDDVFGGDPTEDSSLSEDIGTAAEGTKI